MLLMALYCRPQRLKMENIINDLISESHNDFDEFASQHSVLFEELNNKLIENEKEFSDTSLGKQAISKVGEESSEDAENANQINTEEQNEANKENGETTVKKISNQTDRPSVFAISRIKTIMKLEPDMTLASKESVFLVAKATVTIL